MNRLIAHAFAILLASTALCGCSSTQQAIEKIRNIDIPTPIAPYKVEIVQGNFVSSEQVAALRTGMTKAQVRNILGTALLTDLFHTDRWDYVFTIAREGKSGGTRRLTVYFKDDVMDRFEGDVMPSESEFVQSISSGRKIEKAPPLQATDKQLADFAAKENPKPKASTPVAPVPTSSDAAYPPLESK